MIWNDHCLIVLYIISKTNLHAVNCSAVQDKKKDKKKKVKKDKKAGGGVKNVYKRMPNKG